MSGFLEALASDFAEVSLAASAVIVLLALTAPLLRGRFRAKWQRLVWLVIAVQLVVPLHFTLPNAPVKLEISPAALEMDRGSHPHEPAAAAGSAAISADSTSTDTVPVRKARPAGGAYRALAELDLSYEPIAPASPNTPPSAAITVAQLLSWFWLSGAVLLMAAHFAGYLLFLGRLRNLPSRARPEKDPALLHALETLQAELHIRRRVHVVRTGSAHSPMLTGFFRPLLILPERKYAPEELEAILRHELTHCRHLDPWYQLLLALACALHWFNPLVWWMRREACNTLELACDEAVVRGRDSAYRKSYCEAILSSAIVRRRLPFSTALGGGKRGLRLRFAAILTTRKKHTGAVLLAAVMLFGAVSTSLVACGENPQRNDSLTIFAPMPDLVNALAVPIRRFQSKFPDVRISVVELPDGYPTPTAADLGDEAAVRQYIDRYNAYLEKTEDAYRSLRGELAAGRGPDLLLFDETVFPDINKTMLSGTFADLNALMEAHGEFETGDYSPLPLAAGQYRGHQLVMPLFYSIETMVTTEEGLSSVGYNPACLSDFGTMTAEAARCVEAANQKGCRLFYGSDFPWDWSSYAGLDVADYQKRTAQLDTPEFRAFQEDYRALYQADQLGRVVPLSDTLAGIANYQTAIQDGSAVFVQNTGLYDAIRLSVSLQKQGSTPIYAPIRTTSGGIQAQVTLSAAIRAGSANQKNAFEFLKILLADEFQASPPFAYSADLPVASLNLHDRYAQVRDSFEQVFGDGEISEQWVSQIERVVFPGDLDDRINEWFAPFHRGESSYEDCLKKAQEQLIIYITE